MPGTLENSVTVRHSIEKNEQGETAFGHQQTCLHLTTRRARPRATTSETERRSDKGEKCRA